MYHYLFKQYKKKLNQHTSKNGYDAVGVALSVVFFVGLLMIPLGLFIYVLPRLTLEQDVQQFANTVRLDGYVREEVYDAFAGKMQDRGYNQTQIEQGVEVFVLDSPLATQDARYNDGSSLIQNSTNTNPPIVQRGQGKIGIQVVLPSNGGVFRRAVTSFGGEVGDSNRTYNVARVVMSEAVVRP